MRLQRLANLSIEIRMLRARVQAVLDEQSPEPAEPVPAFRLQSLRGSLNGASCPHCGHTAGLALLPREYRRLSTLVRCFACRRDSAAFDWALAAPQASGHDAPPHSTGTHGG